MAAHFTRSECGDFPVALYIQFSAVGLLLICCGMLGVSVRKMKVQTVKMETVTLYIQFSAVGLLLICGGMLGVSVRKMKAQTVKMETVTLIGKNGENVTCFVFKMYEINSKIYFYIRCIIFAVFV